MVTISEEIVAEQQSEHFFLQSPSVRASLNKNSSARRISLTPYE